MMNQIRLYLDDILNAKLDECVLTEIHYVHEQLPIKQVIFWHNGLSDPLHRSHFEEMAQDQIGEDIRILVTEKTPSSEFAWFDVLRDDFEKKSKNRFSYIYSKDRVKNVVLGIQDFLKVALFVENSRGKKIYYKKEYNK